MKNDYFPFYFDFSTTNSEEVDVEGIDSKENPIADIFKHFSLAGDFEFFCKVKEELHDMKCILILDSINERGFHWRDILEKFGQLVHGTPTLRLIVADRINERHVPSNFKASTIAPLPHEFIAEYVNSSARLSKCVNLEEDKRWHLLLEAPFFLDLADRIAHQDNDSAHIAPSRVNMLTSYFLNIGNLNEKSLLDLGEISFKFYDLAKGTEIDRGSLTFLFRQSGRGEEQIDALKELGIFVSNSENEFIKFRHQMLHDFLVGYYFSKIHYSETNKLWRAGNFDIATINAASFDVFEFAVENLNLMARDQMSSDHLLVEIYDWNYRAVMELMTNVDTMGEFISSSQLKTATYALNLEKKFDHFEHTAQDTRRVINKLEKSVSEPFFHSETMEDLIQYIKKADAFVKIEKNEEEYWNTWLNVFSGHGPVDEKELTFLWRDPLVSWTAANAFRRRECTDIIYDKLQNYYEISRSTSEYSSRAAGFRWRIMHVFGRSREESNLNFLQAVMLDSDENVWVRYGAIRSYVEATSLLFDRSRQTDRLSWMADNFLKIVSTSMEGLEEMDPRYRASALRHGQRLRMELRRCFRLNEESVSVPGGWGEDYLAIFEAGKNFAEKWRKEISSRELAAWEEKIAEVAGGSDQTAIVGC